MRCDRLIMLPSVADGCASIRWPHDIVEHREQIDNNDDSSALNMEWWDLNRRSLHPWSH